MRTRICMLHNLCVSRGGAERLIFSLSRELRRLEYQVDVVVMRYERGICFPELVGGTRVAGLSRVFCHDIFRATPPLQAIELALRLPKGYDLIHAHNFPSAIAAFLASRLNRSYVGTPYIWQCNEPPRILYDPHEIGRFTSQPEDLVQLGKAGALLGVRIMHATSKQLDKLAVRNAAVVTTLSRFVTEQIERTYGCNARVVNPGIDLETFNPTVEGKRVRRKYRINSSPLLLTVSRLWPAKNLQTALKAFQIVTDSFPDAYYMIVGDGPSKPSLQSLAGGLGLAGKVKFVSDAEVEKLAEYYAACNIFVFPALGEPWGLSLTEAMATGKPVVAADDGGPAEIVDHKRNGFLVRPVDPDSYAEAIIHLLENRSIMQDMGDGAAFKAKTYSWEKMAMAYSEIYDHILQS